MQYIIRLVCTLPRSPLPWPLSDATPVPSSQRLRPHRQILVLFHLCADGTRAWDRVKMPPCHSPDSRKRSNRAFRVKATTSSATRIERISSSTSLWARLTEQNLTSYPQPYAGRWFWDPGLRGGHCGWARISILACTAMGLCRSTSLIRTTHRPVWHGWSKHQLSKIRGIPPQRHPSTRLSSRCSRGFLLVTCNEPALPERNQIVRTGCVSRSDTVPVT